MIKVQVSERVYKGWLMVKSQVVDRSQKHECIKRESIPLRANPDVIHLSINAVVTNSGSSDPTIHPPPTTVAVQL